VFRPRIYQLVFRPRFSNKRLQKRIDNTKDELVKLANKLIKNGHPNVAKYILKHMGTVTLFAKEAMDEIKIPWTNNIMERFVGEITFRIKKIWAHWSPVGLNSIIYLIISRYCSKNSMKMEF